MILQLRFYYLELTEPHGKMVSFTEYSEDLTAEEATRESCIGTTA